MIHERLYIERYDWVAYCFFDVGSVEDANHILALLRTIGISKSLYREVRNHLLRAPLDTGFTFSNYRKRESVVVIGMASSVGESFNTFSHELRHLADDIVSASDVPLRGEPVAYLTGDIAMALFTLVADVVCRCPICSRH